MSAADDTEEGGACGPGSCQPGCEPAPIDDPDVAVVLRGGLGDLQRAGERLADEGIGSEIIRAEVEGEGGCCKTTLYLIVARDDVEAAFRVFDGDWKRGLTDEQAAAVEAAMSVVIDPEAAETTCPACLTTFATGPAECPDCGLAIG